MPLLDHNWELSPSDFVSRGLGAYQRFAAAAPIGTRICVVAGIVLVCDLAAMVAYVIRYGEREGPEKAETVDQPLTPVLLKGIGVAHGKSRRKVVGSSSRFVSDESLVGGTATFAERMMVLGIFLFFTSFFLVFLGFGMLSFESNPVVGVVLPLIPGIFTFNFAREAWRDHQKMKRTVGER